MHFAATAPISNHSCLGLVRHDRRSSPGEESTQIIQIITLVDWFNQKLKCDSIKWIAVTNSKWPRKKSAESQDKRKMR